MKLRVCFKTPDAAFHALNDFKQELCGLRCETINQEKANDEIDKAEELLKRFIKNEECITVEIDTDDESIKVVE